MQLINELLNPASRIALTREQCIAQGMRYPSDLVTTASGVTASVSMITDGFTATVPIGAVEENLKSLPRRQLFDGVRKGFVESNISLFDNDDYMGIMIPEGGRCVIQVAIKNH